MKRLITAIAISLLAISSLSAQETDIQMAVATQALNQEMLENLGVSPADIDEILAIQNEFQILREETAIRMNVIKAQIAEKLYYPDSNSKEVETLLEEASRLRLEQEVAQVRNYMQVREHLGEENWTKLMQQIRTQVRRKQATQNSPSTQTRTQPDSASSGNGAAGNGGSTNRR